jgi:tripartite-type tricarboxylate transporter receptor subunit TctC
VGINTYLAVCAIVACASPPSLAATSADGQFGTRPVRFIVSISPGGSIDLIARLMAQRLGDRWGRTVVADNRPGAGGLIASELLARAAPDGHTLAVFNPGQLLVAQLSGKLSFARGGDFTPIARPATTEFLLVLYPGVPAKTVKELVALARAKPRSLDYASPATGSIAHLAIELFCSMAGIQMTQVPYKGIGPSIPDLQSGRVQLTMGSIGAVIPHVQAGRLRALASTGPKRTATLPEVPTFAEAGYPRYQVSVWYGIFGPARMPASLVQRLNADFDWVIQQPDVVERFASAGVEPAGALSPQQFADYMANALVTWDDALRAAGMR